MTLSAKSRRILSLDIFRAITMFLMLFVNEFAGVKGLPHWLYHAQIREKYDGIFGYDISRVPFRNGYGHTVCRAKQV